MLQWAKINRWCKSADPLLAGGDSDNLERYRGVKADLAELDLEERKGVLIEPDEVRGRSEEHKSELQSPMYFVCSLLLEKKKTYLKQRRNVREYGSTDGVRSHPMYC